MGNRPAISSWGSYIYTLQCISYEQGKTGWPGKPINGLVPTSNRCSTAETSVTSTTSTTMPVNTPPVSASIESSTSKFLVTLGTSSARTIALSLGMRVPTTARVSLAVTKKSRSVCRVSKGRITARKVGRCTVQVTVTHKAGWKVKKTTTLVVSRIS
jgi:hypothetical protein